MKTTPEAQNGLCYKLSNKPGNKDILCQSLALGSQQDIVYKEDQDYGVQCVCLGKLLYGLSSTRGQLLFFLAFFYFKWASSQTSPTGTFWGLSEQN